VTTQPRVKKPRRRKLSSDEDRRAVLERIVEGVLLGAEQAGEELTAEGHRLNSDHLMNALLCCVIETIDRRYSGERRQLEYVEAVRFLQEQYTQ
jgi:hypothetical protein